MIAHISCSKCSESNIVAFQEILDLCLNYTDSVEALWFEQEAFIDISKCKPLEGFLREILTELRSICSGIKVGAGKNKLIAKIASQHPSNSPFIKPENTKEVLSKLPITKLWPLNERVQRDIIELGIGTIGELNEISEYALYCYFGDLSKNILTYAAGEDYNPITPNYPEKTFIFTRTLQGACDLSMIYGAMEEMVGDIGEKLDYFWQGAGSILLEVVCTDGNILKNGRKFSYPVYSKDYILNTGSTLFSKLSCQAPIDKMTLCLCVFSGNNNEGMGQANLFNYASTIQRKKADHVVLKINEKFNEDVLVYGKDVPTVSRYSWLVAPIHVSLGRKGNIRSFKWKGKWKKIGRHVDGWVEAGQWWKGEGEKNCFLVETEDGHLHQLFYDNKEKNWQLYSGIAPLL